MPITFEQPQPVAEKISEGYGATQQFNQTLPTLAGMYEAQARRNQAASQAYADNATRASAATAENQTRAQLSQDELASRDVMQARQFQQERSIQAERIQAQQQSQIFDWAVHSDMVSQQEQMRMQRQQAGLAQLKEDVDNGYISKEEAADAAYQLRTNVDRVRQRLEGQQAKHQDAIAKMEIEQVQRKQKAQLAGDALAAKTMESRIIHTKGPNGEDISLFQKGVDANGNPTYDIIPNTKMETEGKRAEIVMKHWETQMKTYDVDVKRYDDMYHKEQARVEKVMHEQEKREGAIPADELHQKVTDNLERRGIRPPTAPPPMPGASRAAASAAVPGGDSGRTEPIPPTVDKKIEATLSSINNSTKLSGMTKSEAAGTVAKIRQLASQPLTPDTIQQIQDMKEYLAGLLK
jgi:hypothetical protein